MGHEELSEVRALRKVGDLDRAERILLNGEPTPAVLDELRKIASTRARQAKKASDWQAVIGHLEGYTIYADRHRQYCIRTVNQEPPDHTKSDLKLLQAARQKVAHP